MRLTFFTDSWGLISADRVLLEKSPEVMVRPLFCKWPGVEAERRELPAPEMKSYFEPDL